MKSSLQCLAITILALPCLLVLNDNENVAINVVGLMYSVVLVLALKHYERLANFKVFIKNLVTITGKNMEQLQTMILSNVSF